jgi:hypothetical protein
MTPENQLVAKITGGNPTDAGDRVRVKKKRTVVNGRQLGWKWNNRALRAGLRDRNAKGVRNRQDRLRLIRHIRAVCLKGASF